ncbi:MAG: hypothetical protein ACR2GT_05695 [Gaiellaceae bacterium]
MRILMVIQHFNFFRNLDLVVRELDARGHEVVVLHGTRDDAKTRAKLATKKKRMIHMGRGIELAASELAAVTVGYRPEPPERWQKRLRVGRQLISRSIYLRRGHPSPERVTEAMEKTLPPRLQRLVQSGAGRFLLGRRVALTAWRRIERMSPPSRTLVSLLKEVDPDVILVSPTVWPKTPVEADYLRTGRALGIPTIGYVNSWDNLTSKGTIHVVPDLFVVWNEALAGEAAELHDISRERIRITGAPHLDRFFELQPSASGPEMCGRMACDPERPYVVYLSSSRTLIADEVSVAKGLADALARQFPDAAPTLVVRPHPTNAAPWDDCAHPGLVVYPRDGDQADTSESWQQYYDQLAGAICVFGLNTTAFLEAVVADRPCLTIVADEFHPTQGRTGHFRHLLAGDFLEVCQDAEGVAARVARILEGEDEKASGRQSFVRSFIRPCGGGRQASLEVVDAIEKAAALRGSRRLDLSRATRSRAGTPPTAARERR